MNVFFFQMKSSLKNIFVRLVLSTNIYTISILYFEAWNIRLFYFSRSRLIFQVVFFFKQWPVGTQQKHPLLTLRLLPRPQAGERAGSVLRRWVAMSLQWLWLVPLSGNLYRFDGHLVHCLFFLRLLLSMIFKVRHAVLFICIG